MKIGIKLHGSLGDQIHASTAFWYLLKLDPNPDFYILYTCANDLSLAKKIAEYVLKPVQTAYRHKCYYGISPQEFKIFRQWNVDIIYNLQFRNSGIWDAKQFKCIASKVPRVPRPYDPWFYDVSNNVMQYLEPTKKNVVVHRYTGLNRDLDKARNLNADKWQIIIDFLKDLNFHVILIGYDDPYPVENVDVNLIKKLDVLESLALARMADLYVGCITGTFHYARFFHASIGFGSKQMIEEVRQFWFADELESTLDNVCFIDANSDINLKFFEKSINRLLLHDIKYNIQKDLKLINKLGFI